MDFVLGLPAQRLPRRRRGEPEEDAAVELERAGPEIMDRREKLRADAMVLLAERAEMAERAGLAIGLKARLDDPSGTDPRLPGIAEAHPAAAGELADLFGQKEVDRIDRRPDLLAQERPELDLVRHAGKGRVAVLDKERGIDPVLAALAEGQPVFPGQLLELEVVAGTGVAARLELDAAFPEIGEAVLDLMDEALLVVGQRIAAAAVIADRFELQFAEFGVGHLDLEIGPGGDGGQGDCRGHCERAEPHHSAGAWEGARALCGGLPLPINRMSPPMMTRVAR